MEAYRAAFAALPAALRSAREATWQRFEQTGFPTRRLEDWHYTDLSALAARQFAANDVNPPRLDSLEGMDSLRFINGLRSDGAGGAPSSELADDGVTLLNAALVRDGLDWTVSGRSSQALHLIQWTGGGAGMSHLRHRIRVARNAEATLLLDIRGDDAESLATTVTEIDLEPNSRLHLIRIQEAGIGATDLARTQVRVQRDAQLRSVGLDLGGATARHDLNVLLAEPGASCEVHGVFAPSGNTHADTHTRIVHAAPHGTSREIYRGIVMDAAHAVFNGRIEVRPGAQKTDSEQNVASLLLSPKAQVNAKPELEIHADDVRCAHGATCGSLDETAVYYLRSRGLDREAARNLLLFTFAHEVLGRIDNETLRRAVERRLVARLPGGRALEELL